EDAEAERAVARAGHGEAPRAVVEHGERLVELSHRLVDERRVAEVAIGIDRGEGLVVAAEHPVTVRGAGGEGRIELAGLRVRGDRRLQQSAEAAGRDQSGE